MTVLVFFVREIRGKFANRDMKEKTEAKTGARVSQDKEY